MSWQDWPIDEFLAMLIEMPDIEAIDEIDARLQRVKGDRDKLHGVRGVVELREALNLEEDKLRLLRNKLVRRLDQRKWSKAVSAVFGEQGLQECLAWMRTQPDIEVGQLPIRKSNDHARRSPLPSLDGVVPTVNYELPPNNADNTDYDDNPNY